MRLLPRTIRGEFALFAVSLALPLVGLIGYGLYDRARDEFADTETDARRLADSSADRAAQYVADLRSTLEAVARRPLVRAMENLKLALRLRLRRGPVEPAAADSIAAALDAAAQTVEKS